MTHSVLCEVPSLQWHIQLQFLIYFFVCAWQFSAVEFKRTYFKIAIEYTVLKTLIVNLLNTHYWPLTCPEESTRIGLWLVETVEREHERCTYTGWPKNGTVFVRLNFIKYWPILKLFFTITVRIKFVIVPSLKIPRTFQLCLIQH